MNAKISELMDGELAAREAERVIAALREEDGPARDTWRTYHLIGDAMRDTALLSPRFAARVAARIAAEPTVLAPPATMQAGAAVRGWGLRVAAGVAAAALVGWVAFAPQRSVESQPPLAQASKPPAVASAEPVHVPPPAAAHDYLLAHQRYSPGVSLQGMAPYVRSVSVDLGARRP